MKRMVLFAFLIIIVVMIGLPATRPQASERNKRLSRHQAELVRNRLIKSRGEAIAERKMSNPHEGFLNYVDTSIQAERQTKEVISYLPGNQQQNYVKPGPGPVRTNPADTLIDKEILNNLAIRNITPAQPATDEEFCRRVFLDITGRQPSPERLLQYVNSTDSKKRDKLIDELIGSDAYIDRWTQWMGDLTRNFTVSPDGTARDRNAEYKYLRGAVGNNKPIDQVAKDFITYTGFYDQGPGAFLVRPIISTEIPQDAYDEIAAEVARTFLGTQMVCVSCHNGQNHLEVVNLYFTSKNRSDFWGMAAFFAQTDFKYIGQANELVNITNNNSGKYDANTRNGMRPPRVGGEIKPTYLFNGAKPNPGEERRTALARMITSDPQFSRAFVNRVFAHFFTVGLVDPVDGFDLARLDPNNPPPAPWELQPSYPNLLNQLAKYFQESNYDLRKLIRLIARSQAYGFSSRYDESKWKEEYVRTYARKLVRRLSAEEVLDAISAATFQPATYAAAGFTQTFSSAMALPGHEEPLLGSYRDNTPRQSDDPYTVYRFLQNFGRGDRNTISRTAISSITQSLSLFNSDIVIDRISSIDGLPAQLARSLQQNKVSPEDAVSYLYLVTLSRMPSNAELDALKTRITGGPEAIADIQWALLNRPDFLYNY